jgi:hypothetical protein
MSIEAIKLELVRKILDTEKPDVLMKVAKALKKEPDWRDNLPGTVIESVERGLNEAENDITVSHEEVIKKHQKWL